MWRMFYTMTLCIPIRGKLNALKITEIMTGEINREFDFHWRYSSAEDEMPSGGRRITRGIRD